MPSTQLSFEAISKDQVSSEILQSKAWQEMVEVGGRICQLLGLPRSTGQIFGLLYLSAEPLSLNQMSTKLGISKGSASMGTRQLASWGAIRKVWIPGDRRDYYEVIQDLGQVIRGGYNTFKSKFESSGDRLEMLKLKLSEDFKSGVFPVNQKEILEGRINALGKVYNRISKLLPMVKKIIS